MKKEVMDSKLEKGTGESSISGDEWYMQDAIRAVNQAIGRVVRHKDDYGSIVFIDSRYSES
jgi:regulator of telomere elongation helicase 1